MPKNRPTGTPGKPNEDDDLDGVVLFDPDAWEPPEGMAVPRRRTRGRGRGVMLLAVPLLAAGGAYAIYELRAASEPAGVAIPPPPPVSPDDSATVPTLTALGREDKSGVVGSFLSLAVRAIGSTGSPLSDSLVHFQVTEGDGVLMSDQARTDPQGIARSELSLPPNVGRVVVTAALSGSELWTTIPVEAVAGLADRIEATGGGGQEAEVEELLPERPTVLVTDAAGNPVPGAEVQFSGDGMFGPSRPRTDSLGLASTLWRLGTGEGRQRLTATLVDLGSAVTFTATARPRPVLVEARPLPDEAGPVTVVPNDFVVGGSHVCELVGGVANCRGANDRGQRGAPSGGLRALASGISHVCGLNASGEATCWGANEGGQIGDGTRTDRPSPVAVRTELHFSTLTAGTSHTCGLAGSGVPVCWGQNLNGQLGDGSRTDARAPRTVGGGVPYRALVAGWSHTCGVSENGNAFCWGLNSDGQLGDGSRIDRLVPTLVRGAVESLAAGTAHTCGIGDGQVLCWGANRVGQLGDGTTAGRPQPGAVIGLPGSPTELSAGAEHTCALVAGGSAYCWGQNLHGQLGNGSTANSLTASPVAGELRFRSIHAGGALTCALTFEGAQYCWGLNQNGQLGDGTRESRSTPTLIGE